MRCDREDCPHEATHRPVVVVPFFDMAPDAYEPSRAVLAIYFCEPHAHAFKVSEIDCDEFRAGILDAHKEAGLPLPDFHRWTVMITPVDGVLAAIADRHAHEHYGGKLS
jgi:hypothetical protein